MKSWLLFSQRSLKLCAIWRSNICCGMNPGDSIQDSTQVYIKFVLALIYSCCNKLHALSVLQSCGKIHEDKHAALTLNFVYRDKYSVSSMFRGCGRIGNEKLTASNWVRDRWYLLVFCLAAWRINYGAKVFVITFRLGIMVPSLIAYWEAGGSIPSKLYVFFTKTTLLLLICTY